LRQLSLAASCLALSYKIESLAKIMKIRKGCQPYQGGVDPEIFNLDGFLFCK
jgi:hypothetical protein